MKRDEILRAGDGRCPICNCDQWGREAIHHSDCPADGDSLDLSTEEIDGFYTSVLNPGEGSFCLDLDTETRSQVIRLISEVVRRRRCSLKILT